MHKNVSFRDQNFVRRGTLRRNLPCGKAPRIRSSGIRRKPRARPAAGCQTEPHRPIGEVATPRHVCGIFFDHGRCPRSSSRRIPVPRHPEKAHPPDQPILRKAGMESRQGARFAEMGGDQPIVKENKLVTVCEGSTVATNIGECWEKKARHLHDHGRHLHPRLWPSATFKTGRPEALDPHEPEMSPRPSRKLGLTWHVRHHLPSIVTIFAAWRRAAFRRCDPRHPRAARPRDDDRDPGHPDFPCAKDGRWRSWVKARPDVFNHNPKQCLRNI